MKKIIATSAIALATLAGAASAMTTGNAAVEDALRSYAPNVQEASLTNAQSALIVSIAHSGDSNSEKRAVIQSLLR